jgi:hypothetical protein
MINRILFLLIGVITVFSLITGFNLFNIYSIKSEIQTEVTYENPNFDRLSSIIVELLVLKDLVTQAGVSKIRAEIESSREKASSQFSVITEKLKQIDKKYIDEINMLLTTEEKIDFTKATEEFNVLSEAAKTSLATSEEVFNQNRLLSAEKKELSKMFRASEFLRKNSEAYTKLSRSVFTVLSSKATGELTFAGDAIFKDAVKIYDSMNWSSDHEKEWTTLKEQFQKTNKLAIYIAATSEDNQLGVFRDSITDLLTKMETLSKTAILEKSKTQTELVKNASNAFNNSIFLSFFIVVLSGWLGIVIALKAKSTISKAVFTIMEISKELKSKSFTFS